MVVACRSVRSETENVKITCKYLVAIGVDMRTEFKVTTGVSVWREISELYSECSDGVLGHDYDRPPPKSENVLT
jgi:hypothetical protein